MAYPIFFGFGFGFGRGGSELFFGLGGGGNFGCSSPAVIASKIFRLSGKLNYIWKSIVSAVKMPSQNEG